MAATVESAANRYTPANITTTRKSKNDAASSDDSKKSEEVQVRMSVLSDTPDGEELLTNEPFDRLMSTNQYSVRKMASQALIDVALMMANIAQLRTLVSGGEEISYKTFLLALVGFSLASQVVFGILIFIIWVRESEAHHQEVFERELQKKLLQADDSKKNNAELKRKSALRLQEHFRKEVVTTRLNHVTMILVFLITITNMLITGFGIQQTGGSVNTTMCI